MKVEIEGLLSAAAHFDRRLVDMIFSCRPASGENLQGFTPNSEIAEARYFAPGSLPDNMSTSQRKLIKVALRQAEANRSIQYQPEQHDA